MAKPLDLLAVTTNIQRAMMGDPQAIHQLIFQDAVLLIVEVERLRDAGLRLAADTAMQDVELDDLHDKVAIDQRHAKHLAAASAAFARLLSMFALYGGPDVLNELNAAVEAITQASNARSV